MAAKAKNSKKQQQTVTTAMVILNPFVVTDEIFGKISTAAASPLSDMNGNSSNTSSKMGQDQPLAVLPDVVLSSRSSPIPVVKQLIISDDFKDWTDQMEMKSTAPPLISGAADGGAWENIAWSSGVASVSSTPLSVALCNVPLGTPSDNIKSALGIFGVVTSFISFAAAALTHWSVLVRKDSIRILLVVNQNDVISSRDTFKAKLVNLSFGCTAFKISDLVSQVGGCTCFIPCSPESY
ncbi:hypothetical protein G9A89_014111 [Geosiphon pyriformis]|nr:hypothetical protein G9A89_014111 [Geosiphon pyriformis]